MNAILAAALALAIKIAPDLFLWIGRTIEGGTVPTEAELEERIARIPVASAAMTAASNAAAAGQPAVAVVPGGPVKP